jgi:PAS domain S-box-containing protein
MEKNIKKLLEETEKLKKENKILQQNLHEAKDTIDSTWTGNIDALVIPNKKSLKIYTEKTADRTYRVLIEKMHEGAVTLNKEGTILYCNSHFANMVKLPLQKVIGKKFITFIDKSSKGGFEDLFEQGWEGHLQNEVCIYANNGKSIPVLMSVNALLLDDNFILSVILTDLTIQNKNQEELKRSAKKLAQKNKELESVNKELAQQNEEEEKRAAVVAIANKDLTTFTYLASHDLQEPLHKINKFVSVLLDEEEKKLSEDGKNYLQRICLTAKGMQALIEDLLTYVGTKGIERKFEKTDLTLIINEVKKDFEEIIQEKKVIIEVAKLCETNVIQFQFQQLIQNLISNSIKFSKPKTPPHITISSKIMQGDKLKYEKLLPKTDYCHITYTDNGIGFDPKYKDRIFEVFQRLHSKEKYKGTGIGLAICQRIMENHKGFITATGKLNKGARFDIYFPTT